MEKLSQRKVAYIHGRPEPHQMHRKFAESVGAEFYFVDFIMRWQDRSKSIFYRILSWITCSIAFPNKRQYQIFLVDNLHFMPVFMKIFHLINKKQKIVAHLGSHTLYFIYSHRFSRVSEYFHVWALKQYDALICEGEMAAELVKNILSGKTPKLYIVYNGIPNEHLPYSVSPDLQGKKILFIGNGPGKERLWYKGLDLMLTSFEIALKKDPQLQFTIVGNWEKDIINELLNSYCTETRKAIRVENATPELGKFIKDSSLYLHCARGEAYGITILIAMASGLPAIISDWTGAKEVISQVDDRLIVPLDAKMIANKIIWYIGMSEEDKKKLSFKSINIASSYTEKRAIERYQEIFSEMERNFQLGISIQY